MPVEVLIGWRGWFPATQFISPMIPDHGEQASFAMVVPRKILICISQGGRLSAVGLVSHHHDFVLTSINKVPRGLFVGILPRDAAGIILASDSVAVVQSANCEVDNPPVYDFNVGSPYGSIGPRPTVDADFA